METYFGFSRREYNGLLVLMTFVLLLSIAPYFYERLLDRSAPVTVAESDAIHQLQLVDQKVPGGFHSAGKKGSTTEAHSTRLFPFDPNEINLEQWQELGLSPKQAQSIVNYRNKGGKFYQPSDLQKMYTITPQKYDQLLPFIRVKAGTGSTHRKFAKQPIAKPRSIIELNGADTTKLDEIKGVGAAFARRIVKYRDRLGGFYSIDQLQEVFGIDSAKFEEIKDQVSLDVSLIQKIDLNTATFETLKNHPYLNYKQINALLQYRKQHGAFLAIDDLRKVLILTPQNIQKLSPYLVFR